MEMLNLWDMHFLLSVGVILIIFLLFYSLASRKQNRAFARVDEALKRQEHANQQLNLMVQELRRANRWLAELAGVAPSEESIDSSFTQQSSLEATQAVEAQPKLYVGNIDYLATEAELASYFSQYGQVEFVNIPVNRYTGKARGFGFVTFVSREDAERAMALHGTEFRGRQIQVNFAKERDMHR